MRYNGRKFLLALIVTVAFIVFEAVTIIYGIITSKWQPSIDFAPFLVYIVSAYITGNVVQDFSPKEKRNEKV